MFYFLFMILMFYIFGKLFFFGLKAAWGLSKICFNDYFIADYFNGDGLMWFALFCLCFINCCRNYKLF